MTELFFFFVVDWSIREDLIINTVKTKAKCDHLLYGTERKMPIAIYVEVHFVNCYGSRDFAGFEDLKLLMFHSVGNRTLFKIDNEDFS